MPSIDQWGNDFERRPATTLLKAAVIATAIVLIIVALVGLATTGSVFFQGKVAKATNPSRVEQKVYDPNNTIAQISFFHDTCQRVNTELRVVENNQARFDADQRAARYAQDPVRQQQAVTQLSQDEQDVTGAANTAISTANEYNSRSAQSTANVFKGNNLPERINLPDPISHGYSVDCG